MANRPTTHLLPSLRRAEELCGGRDKLAAAARVKVNAVAMWHQRGSIPANYLEVIEEASGGEVTVYDLLADIRNAPRRRAVVARRSIRAA